MKDCDALVLMRLHPQMDANRFCHLSEIRHKKKEWRQLHEEDRRFYNNTIAQLSAACRPKALSPINQIRLAHQIMSRGGLIMGLDIEWSQAGTNFIYEMGFSAYIDGEYRTDNLMIRVAEDPKVREDNFRNGRSIKTDQAGARVYLDEMLPHVDAICLHGGSEDAIKMAVFGYPLTKIPVIDTFVLAEALYPRVRHRVVDLYRHFGGRHLRHHVAGNDAEMALHVLYGIMGDQITL